MIYNDKKTSLLVDQQIPGHIRDNPDYTNFMLFVKAYYEWLETSNASNNQISSASTTGQGVTYATKNLLAYKDIDTTIDGFIHYFNNEFLPFFPTNSLLDKHQAIKVARQLYQTKGTPASYQFLFRVLFNSEFDVYYTKDAVFKPSDGVWYVAKSLKLASTDANFLNISQYRLFGEISQSLATIENSLIAGNKTEVFISNIERLFQSGEYVRVIDEQNQDVLFNGQPLRAKVVGQISTISVDPSNRGLTYEVGDPVIVYDGMESVYDHGATAEVSSTTKGSIKKITVKDGGYGYTADPQTLISFIGEVGRAEAVVSSLNPAANKVANATFVATDALGIAWSTKVEANNYNFLTPHRTANANTTLAEALNFTSFVTYPIGSVIVTNGGGGITKIPTAEAQSLYYTQYQDQPTAHLSNLGILAPIQVLNGGLGYVANDTITITGGSGYGAYANITSVAANGAILNVAYVYHATDIYPKGGMGYKQGDLFTTSVTSSNTNAFGAQLFVPGILGAGADFTIDVDRAGSVTTIKVNDPGEDYISTPKISLRVQDILVSNVSIANIPKIGDVVYQGANVNVSVYQATVNSISLLQPYNDPSQSLYQLRVFEYNSNPDTTLNLIIDNATAQINMVMANNSYGGVYNQYGYRNYGDGAATATARFLNGLVVSQGQYLNQQGQPSSFSVLQSEKYNNYTYEITVSKEIEKYRSVLLNLLHPTGTNVIGRMVDRVDVTFDESLQEALYKGRPFYATEGGIGQIGATATMMADFTNPSNNIIQFNNIPSSVNLAEVIIPGTYVQLHSNRMNVHSRAVSIDFDNNKVVVQANTWLTFANVATAVGESNTNIINITGITNAYDLMNNGKYSNTSYPLKDIVGTGDRILIANNDVKTVDYVDYTTGNGIIYLTSNLTSNSNSALSVSYTLLANSNLLYNQIKLYGSVGTTYIPEVTTEDGRTLTTEDGQIILLG